MAIFTKNNKQSKVSLENAPDWRKHPELLSHQARLASCREKLPELSATLANAEQAYRAAEEAFDQAEMLYLAGRTTDAKAVDDAKKARDAAKKAYAIARMDHAECASEHAELEASAQQIEEGIRAEVARTLSDNFMVLLEAQKQAMEAASDAQDATVQYLNHIQSLYPGFEAGDSAFHPGLGLAIMALPNLQKPAPFMGGSALTQWVASYERLQAEHEHLAAPIPPHAR